MLYEVITIAALLATVLSLETLFRSDYEDGTLEQFAISGHPVTVIVITSYSIHYTKLYEATTMP